MLAALRAANGGCFRCQCHLVAAAKADTSGAQHCRYQAYSGEVPTKDVYKLAKQTALLEKYDIDSEAIPGNAVIGVRCKEYYHGLVNQSYKKSRERIKGTPASTARRRWIIIAYHMVLLPYRVPARIGSAPGHCASI
jgi:hypothetical protein